MLYNVDAQHNIKDMIRSVRLSSPTIYLQNVIHVYSTQYAICIHSNKESQSGSTQFLLHMETSYRYILKIKVQPKQNINISNTNS